MADGRSRDPKKESFWRRLVRGQAGSGLTVRAWCGKHGQRVSAFYWWRAELARREAEQPVFVPVRVTEDVATESGALIEIALTSGNRIRLTGPVDRQMLADVLAVLTASSVGPEAPRC